MSDNVNHLEVYALMARCLRGEGTDLDQKELRDLLKAHPHLRNEYKTFEEVLKGSIHKQSAKTGYHDLQKKFDEITKRLEQKP